MKIFKSKIDTWLIAIMVFAAATALSAAFGVASQGGIKNYAVATGLFLLSVGLPLWLFSTTKYVIAGNELKIHSGPVTWRVEIDSITSVSDTRNPLSSPALSLDRLKIKYGNGKTIMVSPADKQGFREAIGHPKQ